MTHNCLYDINCLQWSLWWTVWCCRFSLWFCRETWPSPLLSQLYEFPQSAFVSWLHSTLGNFKYFSACTVNIQFTTRRVTVSNPFVVSRNHQEAAQEGKSAQQHEAKESNCISRWGRDWAGDVLRKALPNHLASFATQLTYLLQRLQKLGRLNFCLLDISHKTKYLLKAFQNILYPICNL